MLLVLDTGNTTTVAGIYDAEDLTVQYRIHAGSVNE